MWNRETPLFNFFFFLFIVENCVLVMIFKSEFLVSFFWSEIVLNYLYPILLVNCLVDLRIDASLFNLITSIVLECTTIVSNF
jgi:hypothetical protein